MLNICRRLAFRIIHFWKMDTGFLSCRHLKQYTTSNYEEVVKKLNTLQSNADVLEKLRKERDTRLHLNIKHVETCLNRIGVAVEDLNKLKVIHISGTKGKGSTSAFCESILRCKGYRTGFYSSPHLVEVRERIRIDGEPISQDLFASYFWHVYSNLWEQKESEYDMPGYFKFLTVMAYYVFLKEKVDVAIIEVGIGGEYDSTNVIRSPVVCGVTSLGLDHVSILGDTVEKIAWAKAGIFKKGIPAFTAPQPKEALLVLAERAKEIGNPLFVVPDLKAYGWGGNSVTLGLAGIVQHVNSSLAMQLASAWININNGNFKPTTDECKDRLNEETCSGLTWPKTASGFFIDESIMKGLQHCKWPGRNQILRKNSAVYFLDGAHTEDSIKACKQWFQESSMREEIKMSGSVFRIVVFNVIGNRDVQSLLMPFVDSSIDLIIFCPNFVHISHHESSDQNAVASPWNVQMERCSSYNYLWTKLQQDRLKQKNNLNNILNTVQENVTESPHDTSQILADERHQKMPFVPSIVFPCICDILQWLSQKNNINLDSISKNGMPAMPQGLQAAKDVHVLISGSLHLVGGFLSVLQTETQDMMNTDVSGLKTL